MKPPVPLEPVIHEADTGRDRFSPVELDSSVLPRDQNVGLLRDNSPQRNNVI